MFSLVGNMFPVLRKKDKICISTTGNYMSNTGKKSSKGKFISSHYVSTTGNKSFYMQKCFLPQLNLCNLNSCHSKVHLNQTNSLVPSKFTSKPLQENSFNSNSHNSKNNLNATNFWVPWTYFSSCNSNFGFGA